MSGLVGWIDFRRDLRSEAKTFDAMVEALRHRGPDGKGVWIAENALLGHRRLAGGGSTPSEQPVSREVSRGTVAMAFDGVIDNVPELRRAVEGRVGRVVRGGAGEVLLQAYLLWDRHFVERVSGAFAFAIWDGRHRLLLLGRDRLGVKPLYYCEYPGGILLASEPKGIMVNRLFERRLDVSAIPILLQPRLALAGETPMVGLREVRPAHLLSYSEVGLSERRYWQLNSGPHRESLDDTARHVRGLLEESVSRQVPGAGQCAAMLSGGIDSTSVAALAGRVLHADGTSRVLDTYCIEFESDRQYFVGSELRPELDSPYAARAAEFLGSRHHTVTAALHTVLDAVPASRRARDLPGWGQFDASMYVLFQEMARNSEVGLSGEAADEFFGGYPYFFDSQLLQRDQFPWLGEGPQLADYLSPEVQAVVKPEDDQRARYSELLSRVPRLDGEDRQEARMREVFFLAMSGPLAVILDRKERMSMAAGLEVRLPFCDHRLVEYVWNVPFAMKAARGLKGLLKAAMADVLPPATLQRRKSAYPHLQDPECEAAVIEEAVRAVSDKCSPVAWMFDAPRFNLLIDQVRANSLSRALPGGVSGAQLLVHVVEMRHWIETNHVSVC